MVLGTIPAGNRLSWPDGDRMNWIEAMTQNFWTLIFVLSLVKTRLGFSHSGMDGDETLGI